MRQNSLWHALLTFLNIAALFLAVYLVIDAVDLGRMQAAKVEQTLNRVNDTLERIARNPAPVAAAGAVAARGGTPAPIRFANDDLRDPLAEDGGGLASRTISFPGNLNYLVNNEATVGDFWELTLDSLAGVNDNDLTKYEPKMAESWEVSPDGLVYTIHLRDNILWDPYIDPVTKKEVPSRQVTSKDFLFFWNTLQNPKVPCEFLRTYFEHMDRIEVVDDLTFKVVWKEPYSLAESFTLGLQPLPEHYYRPDPAWSDERFADEFTSSLRNQWIVGAGPYRLAKWDKNAEARFERNEEYYGPKPAIKVRQIKLIPDTTVSFLEFKRDALDLYSLQPQQWQEETPEPEFQLVTPEIETAHEDSVAWNKRKEAGELPKDYKYEKYQYMSTSWAYIGYNMQRPLFQDKRVRQALTRLIDRKRILDEVFLGLGTIISGPFIPQSPYYNHDIEPLPFDIEGAKKLLADAGWKDSDGDGLLDKDYDGSGKRKQFTFVLMIPGGSVLIRKWSAIIEQDMGKAGIKVEIKPIEWSVYTQSLDKRSFDACSLLWSGGVEGDPYQIWHSSGANKEGSSNYVAYNSPEADRLIEEGRRTVDKQKRYAIYHRFHEVLAEDQPYTFLIAPTATIAYNKRIANAIVYKGGGVDHNLEWIPRSMQVVR